jgi:hypothetical protein
VRAGAVPPLPYDHEALAPGMPAYAGLPMELMNVAGQPVRPESARPLGIPLTSFETWAVKMGG